MLDNLLGADLPVAVRFAVAFVVVALVIVGLVTGSRFLSKPFPRTDGRTPLR